MKYLFSTIIALTCLTTLSNAQINRAHAPAPGPAPQINIGTPASFTTDNGIKVFVVENHKVPKVNVSLILKKDPVLEKNKVGYVSMSGQLMRRGTHTKSKAELDKEIDFLGGHVSTSSGSASASSLTKNFDKIFSIFSDVILHPSFPDSELTKVKKQTLSALESAKDDPSSILRNVVSVANYGKDHPYGENETEQTVRNITVNDLKKYYQTYWKPNIAYMAFVGDITTAHAKKLVKNYLGQWKEGSVPKHTYAQPQKPNSTMVYVADRPSAVQTNINITDPVNLKPGASVYFAARVMNQILGGGSDGRLFQDLREKYGFTYGAYSQISYDPLVGDFSASAAVRTAVTDSSLMRFMYELKKIRNDKVSQVKLDSVKNLISGHFALSLENPAQIANFALNIARYNMPKDYYKNYLKSIDSVTIADVQNAARQFVTPGRANIVLVGNSKTFKKALNKYGRVHYVDNYGNPVSAPVSKSIPKGVTAKSVIENYIKAIGGMDKVKSVKDLTIKASTQVQGQQIEVTQKYLLPDKSLMEVYLQSQKMTITKVVVNGDQVNAESMGQDMPLDSAKRTELKKRANPFAETTLLDGKYKLKLSGIEKVNDQDAYTLQVTDENGKQTTYYFDTKTGYKIRQVSSTDTPKGKVSSTIDMGDYKVVDGIKFPFTMKSQIGPVKMNLKVDSIKINSGLSADAFK